MLHQSDRRTAGVNAPAHGLVLWKVTYSKNNKPTGSRIQRP